MKSLYNFLKEDGAVATPCNTVGMGNPMLPTDSSVGSEPLITAKCKKEKKNKKRSLKKDSSF